MWVGVGDHATQTFDLINSAIVMASSMTTSTALLTWINIPTRALCWTFTVIFLLETSKIILHCNQSGDDNIAEYGFDGDEMNIR
jgi:hypothetical protein